MRHYSDIQSLQRVFDLLDLVGSSHRALTLREISTESGIPRSSTYRFLRNLEIRGYLRCDSDGRYHLGLKFIALQQKGEENFELKNITRPHLEELNRVSGETVHLGVRFRNRVLYVDSIESSQLIRMIAQVGSTIGVYCTALGKVLMMDSDPNEITEILATDPMTELTEFTITDPETFIEKLGQVRKQGFALDDRESSLDSRCVGAPIRDREGRIIGALSVSGPLNRMTGAYLKSTVVPILLKVTKEISEALGYDEAQLSHKMKWKTKKRRDSV